MFGVSYFIGDGSGTKYGGSRDFEEREMGDQGTVSGRFERNDKNKTKYSKQEQQLRLEDSLHHSWQLKLILVET